MKKVLVMLVAVLLTAPLLFERGVGAQENDEMIESEVMETYPVPGNPGMGPGIMKGKMLKKPGFGPQMRKNNFGKDVENIVMGIVEKNDPEFAKKLFELKKTNPVKYNQVIKISFNFLHFAKNTQDPSIEKDMVRGISLEYDVRELALRYKNASDADKTKIKSEMKNKLNELFEIRTKVQELRLKRLENEIKELKDTITKRRANKDKIVDQRLNQLIGGKELNW